MADLEQEKNEARLRATIFNLVIRSGTAIDPDKALEKAKIIYRWIKEGK